MTSIALSALVATSPLMATAAVGLRVVGPRNLRRASGPRHIADRRRPHRGSGHDHTAAGRALLKQRFIAFQSVAHTGLGDLTRRSALEADFSKLMSDCQSCHDTFNN